MQELRDADAVMRQFYPPEKQMGKPAADLALALAPEASQQVLQQRTIELANVATDLGADRDDLSTWANLAKKYARDAAHR